jgi:hypothetical protein
MSFATAHLYNVASVQRILCQIWIGNRDDHENHAFDGDA